MPKYTIDEKVKFNAERGTSFGVGYSFAVGLYRDYPKSDAMKKATINSIFTNSKVLAQQGDPFGKGVMCGLRDAANERKAKKKT